MRFVSSLMVLFGCLLIIPISGLAEGGTEGRVVITEAASIGTTAVSSASKAVNSVVIKPKSLLSAKLGIPAMTVTTNADGGQNYTVTLQILILMTVLSVLPALLMMMTAFTRIIIVFSILRQAIGLQQTPSNQILLGLALFLTFFIMAPVFEAVDQQAIQPYLQETISTEEAGKRALQPFHQFMLAQTREDDLAMFMGIAKQAPVENLADIPMTVLMPSFVTSELKTAFQIGFMLFIPFLIIDLVVASVLMAMGMMMLSPLIVSLPFKIMLFVFVDGWAMVIGTMASSFKMVI